MVKIVNINDHQMQILENIFYFLTLEKSQGSDYFSKSLPHADCICYLGEGYKICSAFTALRNIETN
jgi:hypothetical protein